MRFLLLLLLPVLVPLVGLLLRTWIAMRTAERDRIIEATVIRARSSSEERSQSGDQNDLGRERPSCGRHNLHLLFRLVGGERSCRHCVAIERARQAAEAAAAVSAAEQTLRGDHS
ncbi:MAG: hypothetical protein CL897_05860 [Dehalococcoidia bacterium]|nr:hypothetical protein [Dehalococcoidia bacterium]HCV00689.1 hypothetical protein [Dehalococcoidia bacterium]